MERGRLLGVDVGARRTGVAMSQGSVAVPLEIIEEDSRNVVIARVLALAAEQAVEAIVVGLPVSLSGEEQAQAKRTRSFGDALVRALEGSAIPSVAVVYEDEALSTADVTTYGPEAGTAGTRRTPTRHGTRARSGGGGAGKRRVDDLAAAVILQRYLDERAAQAAADERAPGDAGQGPAGAHRQDDDVTPRDER
jgi:putative Holliday junction resolvase